MTLDEAIRSFGTAETIPTEAILWARDHWEEVFPRLESLLSAYLDDLDRSEFAESALFFLLHLAAEQNDTAIHVALCRLLLDPMQSAAVLGDAITETLPGLLISTYDDDPAPMQSVIEHATADPLVRSGTLLALARLTHDGRLPRDWMHSYLDRLFIECLPREGHPLWADWVTAVAGLRFQTLVPQAEEAFRAGWVEPDVMELRHFQEALRDALADPTGDEVFARGQVEPFTDLIALLEQWRFGSASTKPEADEDGWLTRAADGVPYVDPMRHVGRNDLCPCGSGKKYKKCCLTA